MSTRIQSIFKRRDNILSVYFTAGYPALEDTLEIVKNLDAAGVDLIEIGMPFSDPLADGPVIQESSQQAIKNGMTIKLLFEQLKGLRDITEIPVVLMGYLNPVMQYGEEAFISKCAEVGVDGIILPDLPLDIYTKHWKTMCEKEGVSNIFLITPQSSVERIKAIDDASNAFVYVVSSNSITGSNKKFDRQTAYYKSIQQLELKNPTLIGFGIHDKETFESACTYSKGVIIGSAFIRHITAEGISKESIQEFVKNIKS
ncbi:tryptophan synthase subunit alpha [Planktosalinus lacus]|uniref:Tryptophan synthase alpha chain n=1 Tax=Planktosalinus lacus TaxID=1526573 RepID=A0A8J2Y7I9_9FLAO|nr:tryptophan synthase subunit alpha [Planktosalinus lacus]GGD96958.1 tryptophan synthase alpha chain [Planktosalinus lacus]